MKYPVKPAGGFTLIEMMVVVAIAGILVSVAMPMYRTYVEKANLRTAQNDLVVLAMNYENFYQRTLAYPTTKYTDVSELKAAFPAWSPVSDAADFEFSSTVATGKAYTLQAKAISGDLTDCVITLTQDNDRVIADCDLAADGSWL